MKTEVLIYIATEAVPHRHEVTPETTFEEIIVKLRGDGVITAEMIIVEEDGEEEIILTEKVGNGGERHKRVLHCHPCRHIHVEVAHPGSQPPGPLKGKFRPGTRVGLVKNWAVSHVPGLDQNAKWCLRDGAGEILDNEWHIGTLASHPGCALKVALTEHEKPKG
jgi:hypothetical protein